MNRTTNTTAMTKAKTVPPASASEAITGIAIMNAVKMANAPSTLQAITPAITRGIRIGPRIRTLPSWRSQSHPLRHRRERFLPGAHELDDDGGQHHGHRHFLY